MARIVTHNLSGGSGLAVDINKWYKYFTDLKSEQLNIIPK